MRAILTDHDRERVRGRVAKSERIAGIALERGLKHSECKGALRRHLDGLFLAHGHANNMRVFGEHVYLFCERVLVTVLSLPTRLRPLAAKLQSRRPTHGEEPKP